VTKSPSRRHLFIPDTQIRPGVPLDHIDWIGQACVDYKPDVIVVAGDWWDFASLNGHSKPGSAPLEGTRFETDVKVGNAAFHRFESYIEKEKRRLHYRWDPEEEFLCGNHEDRADRAALDDPKWMGTIGSNHCNVGKFKWNGFLKRVWIDGIVYSHYFQSSHSKFAIGGSIDNRFNKIGASFIQGHEQGKREGSRIMASGKTWYGLVAGSCYLHEEEYRGAQGQRHWRGIVVLNEVEDGEYDIMPLSLRYLCKRYENKSLYDYMTKKYKDGNWEHLR
jgi:hypothetical protein